MTSHEHSLGTAEDQHGGKAPAFDGWRSQVRSLNPQAQGCHSARMGKKPAWECASSRKGARRRRLARERCRGEGCSDECNYRLPYLKVALQMPLGRQQQRRRHCCAKAHDDFRACFGHGDIDAQQLQRGVVTRPVPPGHGWPVAHREPQLQRTRVPPDATCECLGQRALCCQDCRWLPVAPSAHRRSEPGIPARGDR